MNKPLYLAAEALAADPRVKQAKQLLLEAVQLHQKTLTGIRPPNPNLSLNYKQLLDSFAEHRGSKLWFPFIGSGIGNGSLVELLDGSVKYDFITGIGPHYLGHSHPDIIASSIDAAISDTIMQGNLQQNADSVSLIELLTQSAQMDHCFLSSSGAMANENALKIVFQKRFPAHRILAFDHCFAGRTVTLSQITDKPSFREGVPETIFVDYLPFYNPLQPEESSKQTIKTLKKYLTHHPKEYALMVCELVQGEHGFYPGSKEFFKELMMILKENQISILADEIQTFGRTSALFAFQHFELQEYVDLVTIGKLSQVCATLFNKNHRPRPGLLSQTFTSSTSAIRAANVMLHELLNNNYFGASGKNMHIFEYFSKNLQELSNKYPHLIQGPYGIGSMIAFTPFKGEPQSVMNFVHALFDEGVMSFTAGVNPTRVRFLVPAGAVTSTDIDAVIKIIETVLLKG